MRSIINQFQIAFFEVQLAECRILTQFDFTLFNEPTVFDYIQALAVELKICQPELKDGFLRFIDNIYLYILVSDQYKYAITVICMVSSLVFFTAKKETEIVEQVYRLLSLNSKHAIAKYKVY